MKYTTADLCIIDGPIQLIQKRPHMFVHLVNGLELASKVAAGACLLVEEPVNLQRKGHWWIVASEQDWMTNQANVSVQDLFLRNIPFPEAGPNSMHPEVLLTAFADRILTQNGEECLVIKGTIPSNAEIWQHLKTNPQWKRTVAFEMTDEEPANHVSDN